MGKKKQLLEAKQEAKTYLVMKDGKRYELTGESGKYYLCGATQFRKGNPNIEKVEAVTNADRE